MVLSLLASYLTMVTLMLKLWGRVNSINVQKVLWVLDSLALDYTRTDAGLEFSVNKSNDYLAKNPNGRVPLLEDGDYQIWESHSICRYLCNVQLPGGATKQVADHFYPQDLKKRGQVDQWLDWTLWGISAPMVTVFRQRVRLAPEKREPLRMAEAEAESREHLRVANHRLEESAYLAGEHLSLADIALAPIAYRASALGLVDATLTGMDRWLSRLQKEKGYQKWVAVAMT